MMKNLTWKPVWMYLPAVCFMVVIFWFSSQPALESSEESGRIVSLVLHCLEYIRRMKFSPDEFSFWAERIHTPIRKMAHMTEYAILAWTFFIPAFIQNKKMLFGTRDIPGKSHIDKKGLLKLCFCSLFAVTLYASTDEFHQLFVEGRSGKITDVLIDTCGAVLGILGFLLLWKIITVIRHKQEISEISRAQ